MSGFDAKRFAKDLDRAIHNEKGKAIIKDKLGLTVRVDSAETPDDRPLVAILVPTYKAPHPKMQSGLAAMCEFTRRTGLVRFYSNPCIQSSVVHWTRNELLATLIKSGKPWTHVLFLDDDIVPPEDGLVRMLSHGKDLVGALCSRRCDPAVPNMRMVNLETGDFGEVWTWKEGDLLGGEFLPPQAAGHAMAIGTGMMLISREAIQKGADAYLNCDYEREVHGWSEEQIALVREKREERFDKTGNAWWFRFQPARAFNDELGEDIYFCWFLKKFCNIDTYVDTGCLPEHMGDYGYSIADYLADRDAAVAKARREGRYIPPALNQEVPVLRKAQSSNETISILCPTRGRPESVRRLIKSLDNTADTFPELLLYVDEDDETMRNVQYPLHPEIKIVTGPRITLSDMWNKLAEKASGTILFNAGDDLVFKTKGWDTAVKEVFDAYDDKIIFVHGNDGHWGSGFGTHGFVHRKWVDAVGYFIPPYFASDYGDTWLNEVANALGRRVYLKVDIEHLHPMWGKAEWDKTHKERLERHNSENVKQIYADKLGERLENVERLRKAMKETYGTTRHLQGDLAEQPA